MIICVCANISEVELRQSALLGTSTDQIIRMTGACSSCMSCCEDIHRIIDDVRLQQTTAFVGQKINI